MLKQSTHWSAQKDILWHRACAWMFTVAVMIGCTQLAHQELSAASALSDGQYDFNAHMARSEGEKETARLPEEYDVGIRVAPIGRI